MTDYPGRIIAKKLIKIRRPLMPVINVDTDKPLRNISITETETVDGYGTVGQNKGRYKMPHVLNFCVIL
jgi:hypothetical protein